MPWQITYEEPKDPSGSVPRTCSYGWVPDRPDPRDLCYKAPRKIVRDLPRRIDLRAQCPPVYRQGTLNSCTANAIAAAIQFEQIRQRRREKFRPSRLFIYYNERALEHSIDSDDGAGIRTGIKTVAKRGVCPEPLWPYRIRRLREKPLPHCYTQAARYRRMISYRRIPRSLPTLKACLASGYPFTFGFTVYQSLHAPEVTRTGRGGMPIKHDKIRGGHAVLAVGYDESEKRFILRNSWGRKWGMEGYFTLPYDYLMNRYLSQDFWTIRLVN
jgi:C1A family cysteine protease